ncbi:MAG: EF-hand domain-containing protein [Steroidobacteraceae bacterium]
MRLTLIIASLAVAGVAQAGNMQPAHPAGYAVDANKDGIVSREEAKDHPRLASSFDAWDKNKDGSLDEAEMTAHREAMRAEMRAKAHERLKAADTDGDGSISRQEAEASMPGLAAKFDRMDADKDGKISSDEMHGFRAAGKKHERKHMRMAFKSADKNGDGALDKTEAEAGMPMLAEHFATIDADQDGKVTHEELRAHKRR